MQILNRTYFYYFYIELNEFNDNNIEPTIYITNFYCTIYYRIYTDINSLLTYKSED